MPPAIRFIQFDVGGFNDQSPAFRHGVSGIHDEVQNDLLDLPRIGLHLPETRSGERHNIDVFTDQAMKHFVHIGDDAVEIQLLRHQHLSAAEGQQLAG